jgi:hypothetical protein
MTTFQDRAYAMTALSVVVVVLKVLVKKGVLARDEAVRALLDEAVAKAIAAAEADRGHGGSGDSAADANEQSVEMLKFIAEQL